MPLPLWPAGLLPGQARLRLRLAPQAAGSVARGTSPYWAYCLGTARSAPWPAAPQEDERRSRCVGEHRVSHPGGLLAGGPAKAQAPFGLGPVPGDHPLELVPVGLGVSPDAVLPLRELR